MKASRAPGVNATSLRTTEGAASWRKAPFCTPRLGVAARDPSLEYRWPREAQARCADSPLTASGSSAPPVTVNTECPPLRAHIGFQVPDSAPDSEPTDQVERSTGPMASFQTSSCGAGESTISVIFIPRSEEHTS